jgi:8-oxo-dGTP pyrophosphatase MutT (NUDIX family)
MNLRRVVLIVPYNNKLEILFQDRRSINKPLNKDYGFFGGGIEGEESIEEALAREVKEELSLDIKEFDDLEFFKKYYYEIKEKDISRELHVFLCKMPEIDKLDIKEGKGEIISIEKAMKLDISNMDKQILKEVLSYLRK